jgi:enoyl-CoA hydratase/carnithine racemase
LLSAAIVGAAEAYEWGAVEEVADPGALASFSEDHKEGVAAFLGRRKPRFRGC